MEWQLSDAKNQFSKVIQKARTQGPQIVTLRGERAVVVLSTQDYDALVRSGPTLVDDLLSASPWSEALSGAVSARAKSQSRVIDI